jgi:hypothetical protein
MTFWDWISVPANQTFVKDIGMGVIIVVFLWGWYKLLTAKF